MNIAEMLAKPYLCQCPTCLAERKPPLAPATGSPSIILMFCNEGPCGWTTNETTAVRWMLKMNGRGYRFRNEILPSTKNESR